MTAPSLPAEPRPEWIVAIAKAISDENGQPFEYLPAHKHKRFLAYGRAAYRALRKAMETT